MPAEDLFHLPDNSDLTAIFYGSDPAAASTGTGSFKTWQKPRGISMVMGFILGPGAGGGGGSSGATSTVRAGGGGGGGGVLMKFIAPAFLLPDTLYIYPGTGGQGGGAGATGSASDAAFISLTPAVANALWFAGTGSAAGGGAGTTSGGALGTAAIVSTVGPLGYALQTTGAVATAAAAGATGAASYVLTFNLASATFAVGGAGGGGASAGNVDGAGGYVGISIQPFFTTNIAGGTTPGGNGTTGGLLWKPILFVTPGTGGGSNAAGTGGTGGNGGYGCGGGGGGGGLTGGPGGAGGPGMIILTCW